MEESERPTKLRKLNNGTQSSHGSDGDLDNNDIAIQTTSQHGDVSNSPSKPTIGIATNGAVTEDDSCAPSLEQKCLSKNQLKKARRKAEWEAGREDRKLKRREKMKEKKARRKERQAQIDPGDIPAPSTPFVPTKRVRLPIAFVIDCGFDNLMTDKERISLGSQLTRAYSDNSKAPYYAHLCVSSWSGQLRDRFDTVIRGTYKNWKGIEFTESDFVEASTSMHKAMKEGTRDRLEAAFARFADHKAIQDMHTNGPTEQNGTSSTQGEEPASLQSQRPLQSDSFLLAHISPDVPASDPSPGETIYLTSDSPYTLSTLHPYTTYIIGGLVDKNRHKGICYKRALDVNTEDTNRGPIKTAKLPIGQYMEMTSRFVLATNHVVEIMLRWLECGDWGEAFLKVMPKRKGGRLREIAESENDKACTEDDHEESDVDESEEQAQDSGVSEAPNHDQTTP